MEERGLGGMRERAMLIDAQLEIRSDPASGTEVVLSVLAG
jgi:signal transduction histidine kinase